MLALALALADWWRLRCRRGVIPRVIDALFERLKLSDDDRPRTVRASYIELYREDIRDLLNPDTPAKVCRAAARPVVAEFPASATVPVTPTGRVVVLSPRTDDQHQGGTQW